MFIYSSPHPHKIFFKDNVLAIYSGRARGCVTTLLLRNSRVTSTMECELELFCCGEAESKGQRF